MGRTKIFIPNSSAPQANPLGAGIPLPPNDYDKYPDKNYHLFLAGILGVIAFICCLFLVCCLFVYSGWARAHWTFFVLLPPGVGLGVAGYLAFTWISKAATGFWKNDDLERARRHFFEDEAYRLSQTQEEEEESGITGREIELTGHKIMALHFVHGLQATREECEARGINQETWNAVNKVLKSVKIKNDRSWAEMDYQEAFEKWEEVKFSNDRYMYMVYDPTTDNYRGEFSKYD